MASRIRDRLKPNSDRRLKKLTYQLKFLREELWERNDRITLYRLELHEATFKYLNEIGFKKTDEDSQDETAVYEVSSSDAFNPISQEDEEHDKDDESLRAIKKLYRKIVLSTHPDKVQHMADTSAAEREERSLIYQQACEAFKYQKIDDLVEFALYLGLEVEMPLSIQIDRIEDQIRKIKGKVDAITKAVEWNWGNNFGNHIIRAQILAAVCIEVGAGRQDERVVLDFIKRYDTKLDRPTP